MERVRRQVGLEDVWRDEAVVGETQMSGGQGEKQDWKKRKVTVGVLDTGVGNHPDLWGRVMGFQDFVGKNKLMYDDNGHGTHICGIIGGSGGVSGGRMKGMAPESRLVVGKVLDHNGDGMTKHMLEALDLILEVRKQYQIRVLNISVGIGEMSDKKKQEALQLKIEEVWSEGIVVVCAAGNKGPMDGSISAVSGSERVITVGCHDGSYGKDNPKRCSTYSGRGKFADRIRKPDVVAPGTDIRSCNVNYREINHLYGNQQFGKNMTKEAYVAKSGTSMATPIVTGAIALLLQKFPDMSNEDVKRKLTYTATDLGEPWNLQGWGMINVKKLLERY